MHLFKKKKKEDGTLHYRLLVYIKIAFIVSNIKIADITLPYELFPGS